MGNFQRALKWNLTPWWGKRNLKETRECFSQSGVTHSSRLKSLKFIMPEMNIKNLFNARTICIMKNVSQITRMSLHPLPLLYSFKQFCPSRERSTSRTSLCRLLLTCEMWWCSHAATTSAHRSSTRSNGTKTRRNFTGERMHSYKHCRHILWWMHSGESWRASIYIKSIMQMCVQT